MKSTFVIRFEKTFKLIFPVLIQIEEILIAFKELKKQNIKALIQ